MPNLERKQAHSQSSCLINSVRASRIAQRSRHFGNPVLVRQQTVSNQDAQRFAQSCPLALPGPSLCPFGGACHACPTRVQAKLTVNQPGDKYEQEADRVAEQVMRMPEPKTLQRAAIDRQTQDIHIQRLCPECEEEVSRQPIEEEEEGGRKAPDQTTDRSNYTFE